ncbi:MAG: FIST C-terminal domain-containing protein [Deltaproteobacteria bacterium]|jgi:hypothetical protein|nr:FIST C-terminal domain-containing protein [Deltaproteobacteria bacterium]
MYKAFIAYTEETDEIDVAMDELMGQLDLSQLLPNSVGLVFCDASFYFSGVYKALCEKFPFPILGATTISAAAPQSRVSQILALMIITSDELRFSVALSDTLKNGDDSVVERLYQEAKKDMEGEPALIMTYYPLFTEYDPDDMINTLSRLAPGKPIYGTLTSSQTLDSYSEAKVLYGGEGHDSSMSLLLIYGDIQPRFFRGSFSEEKLLKDKGVITSCKENRILTINDIPAKEYFIKMGISADDAGNLLFPELFPVILDLNDGSLPYIRAMFTSLDDGSVVLNGGVRQGATISLSTIDIAEIQASVDKTLETLKAQKEEKGFSLAIFHSCAARYFVAFGYDVDVEIKAIKNHLSGKDSVPYVFCYSGGEICPVVTKDNSLTNRVHTYTIVACVF